MYVIEFKSSFKNGIMVYVNGNEGKDFVFKMGKLSVNGINVV